MARLLYLLIGFALGVILAVMSLPRPAHSAGACTVSERLALMKEGYTKQEVNDLCAPATAAGMMPAEPFAILRGEGQPGWSQWCATSKGRCWINPAMGYYAPGTACNCYMPWGTYNGVVDAGPQVGAQSSSMFFLQTPTYSR